MALVKCKECGCEVSTKAKACPQCGAKAPRKTSLFTWAVLFLIIYVAFKIDFFSSSGVSHHTHLPEKGSAPSQGKTVMQTKLFTEDEFYFDEATTPYKEIIIAGVNKVHQENERCDTIDPSSAYISSTKGSKANPVFFVTCGQGTTAFNVFFSKSDIKRNKQLSAKNHIDKSVAIDLCENYAKSKATHPSTVKFSRLMDLAAYETPNGRTRITSTFTAKNSLNLELEYNISCLFDDRGLLEADFHEAN